MICYNIHEPDLSLSGLWPRRQYVHERDLPHQGNVAHRELRLRPVGVSSLRLVLLGQRDAGCRLGPRHRGPRHPLRSLLHELLRNVLGASLHRNEGADRDEDVGRRELQKLPAPQEPRHTGELTATAVSFSFVENTTVFWYSLPTWRSV